MPRGMDALPAAQSGSATFRQFLQDGQPGDVPEMAVGRNKAGTRAERAGGNGEIGDRGPFSGAAELPSELGNRPPEPGVAWHLRDDVEKRQHAVPRGGRLDAAQDLRDFQDNEKSTPTILTTSQKLSTGVDARNIRNIVLMRPINSMIEFKQIIGRGTRLYDGKDYFTIYDFVGAHMHFLDPEWDGEPIPPEEPDPCMICGQSPCVCVRPPPGPCPVCDQRPCVCPPEPCEICGQRPCVCRRKVKVKLADGKARNIQHMMMTSFWHPDGTPMSSVQFMELLFGKLPDFFKNEEELREIWCAPDTRKKLLEGLAENGFGHDQLTEMQKIIDAEDSDLFDVLAHVAYAMAPLTREVRASNAKVYINTRFDAKQQVFLAFVLQHYVAEGVEELAQDKLTPLLRLRYHDSIADAVADLGENIGEVFIGFQKYLYETVA